MDLIKPFSELTKSDIAIAGGKGAALGEMTHAGIPVPPGFVILAGSFEDFIEETEIKADIDAILHGVKYEDVGSVEQAAKEIKAIILAEEMPKDIENKVESAFKKLDSKFVAVRSSATSEDSSTAAWAGQLESYLNVTEGDLFEKVKNCWASLFTPRAIVYRFGKNLHKTKISVAVIIQKMIQSDEAGIAFSVHPITQDHNQLIIEAGYGLGEAVVSGQITPDSYIIEKTPRRIIDRRVQVQKKGLFKIKNGKNVWKVIGKMGAEQKLTDKQIFELSGIVLRIEKHFGFPCDVEWACEKEKFYIVQSRPITTLTKER